MLSRIDLPNEKDLLIYYTDKVYSPRMSAVDTIVVADIFLPPLGRVLDVGTGSGVIALSLKRLNPGAEVYASDIDIKAVRLARGNAERLDLKVKIYMNDLLKDETEQFDVVVSNLPTFDEDDIQMHELHGPKTAYFADTYDGLKLYRELIDDLDRVLKPEGVFVCECQAKLKESLKEHIREKGWEPIMETDHALAFVRLAMIK